MIQHPNYLVRHAYNHVWCSPEMDKQFIIAPARVSDRRGALTNMWLGPRQLTMPTKTDRYHVFTYGALPPKYVGMCPKREVWVRADVHSKSTSLLVELYFNTGIQLPLYNAWFLFTRGGDLVIAVKHTTKFHNLRTDQMFTRWRSNPWFDGQPGILPNEGIKTNHHEYLANNAAYQAFRADFLTHKNNPIGYAYVFVNGKKVSDFAPATLVSGDIVWWVWDGSVKEVSEIKLSEIKSFISELDSAPKYMYFRAGLGDTIDYRDDVDFYILNYVQAARFEGVYYHHNQKDAYRNVTHRDFSLKSAYVDGYITGTPGWGYHNDIRIQCVMRHSGWPRALVDEHHRIKDLYKLPEARRRLAMIGEDTMLSDVEADVWKASNLENSYYPKVMDALWGKITDEMVLKAYGYNAVSKLIGNAPVEITMGQRWVKILYSQYCHSTVYEYDQEGKLLGWYPHRQHTDYAVRNPLAKYIEAYAGTAGVGLNTQYDTHKDVAKPALDALRDYRFYLSDIRPGREPIWEDITGNAEWYEVDAQGVVTWKILDKEGYTTAIRNDLDFLSYDITFNTTNDILVLSVTTKEVVKGRAGVQGLMEIPPGEVDIFLNGYDLVKGIDYYMNWPEFGIVNKSHLNPDGVQKVTIRCRGFCTPDFQLDQPMDSGFIRNRQLSRNARYNLRDDKVTRCSVGGELYLIEELGFAEDGTLNDPSIPNGQPYRITHPIIPGLDLVHEDIYAYRKKSLDVDKEVEDYLTEYLPQEPNINPNPIPADYLVISLFCMRIIQDMQRGIIDMEPFEGSYTDQEMMTVLDNYSWILAYDPVVNQYDQEFCLVHPHQHQHMVQLTYDQYRLLDRAVKQYLQGGVNLSRYIQIV